MKLGIYGGSFDPVHLGHLLVAQAAVEELGLDKLFFVPAAQSPFKPDAKPAPNAVRLQLLRLALAGKSNCEIDEQEIQRGGTSYTIETLRSYAKRFPGADLFYLIGADNAAKLNEWREAAELATLTEFIAVPRR
jgi:nicotinate-nucleotide adenylyltransferase